MDNFRGLVCFGIGVGGYVMKKTFLKNISQYYKVFEYRTFKDLIFYDHELNCIYPKADKQCLVYFPNGYGISIMTERDNPNYFVEAISRKMSTYSTRPMMKGFGFTVDEDMFYTQDTELISKLMIYLQKKEFVSEPKAMQIYLSRSFDYDIARKGVIVR